MNEFYEYILFYSKASEETKYLAAARGKKDLFKIMKIHMYVIEQEGEYSFEYVKRNLDYFEYISNLIPSEVADMLNSYEYYELVMPL